MENDLISQIFSQSVEDQKQHLIKSEWIQIRCTHDEKAKIRKRAEEEGRTISNYLIWNGLR